MVECFFLKFSLSRLVTGDIYPVLLLELCFLNVNSERLYLSVPALCHSQQKVVEIRQDKHSDRNVPKVFKYYGLIILIYTKELDLKNSFEISNHLPPKSGEL